MKLINDLKFKLNNSVLGGLSYINNNEYLAAGISLFLILYAGLAAPQLPEYVVRIFDNIFVKMIVFFLIAYSAKKNPTVAVIATIAVMVTLQTLSRYDVNNIIKNMIYKTDESQGESMPENMGEMEEIVPEDELMIKEGHDVENIQNCELSTLGKEAGCETKNANFRNNFYPQYTNMKPDAYMARYTGEDVIGVSD